MNTSRIGGEEKSEISDKVIEETEVDLPIPLRGLNAEYNITPKMTGPGQFQIFLDFTG